MKFTACVLPLGLTNKKLPNSAFTASSEVRGIVLYIFLVAIMKTERNLVERKKFVERNLVRAPLLICCFHHLHISKKKKKNQIDPFTIIHLDAYPKSLPHGQPRRGG